MDPIIKAESPHKLSINVSLHTLDKLNPSSARRKKRHQAEFATCFACLQGWFIRASWWTRLGFLGTLVAEIESTATLASLLNTLYTSICKDQVYESVQNTNKFIYDKVPDDDDRALDYRELIDVMGSNTRWFKMLEQDLQETVVIGLLRMSGGTMQRKIYFNLLEKYQKRIDDYRANLKESIELQLESSPPSAKASGLATNVKKSPSGNMRFSISDEGFREEQVDTKDPIFVEVDKQKKVWNRMISKLRDDLEKKRKKSRPKPPKKKKSEATSKSSKSTKSSKSSKTTGKTKSSKTKSSKTKSSVASKKSSRKSRGDRANDVLDYVQLLPIWTSKRIIAMLDKESLEYARQVNRYWSYLVDEVENDAESRKYVTKISKKLGGSKSMDDEKEEIQSCHKPAKKHNILPETDATHPDLRNVNIRLNTRNCLLIKTLQDNALDYIMQGRKYESFPRTRDKDEDVLSGQSETNAI